MSTKTCAATGSSLPKFRTEFMLSSASSACAEYPAADSIVRRAARVAKTATSKRRCKT